MKIQEIATAIAVRGSRLVLIAGPVGSGSEHMAERLKTALDARGLQPMAMDTGDFALPAAAGGAGAPGAGGGGGGEEGEEVGAAAAAAAPEEEPASMDVAAFAACFGELIKDDNGSWRPIVTPTGRRIRKRTNGLIILYGPYALDQKLLGDMVCAIPSEAVFKVFVEPISQLNVSDLVRCGATKACMIRHLAAARRSVPPGEQSASARRALAAWRAARRRDAAHLWPRRPGADLVLNAALPHEVAVLKQYVSPLLRAVSPDQPDYQTCQELLHFMGFFESLPSTVVSDSSVLKQFVLPG